MHLPRSKISHFSMLQAPDCCRERLLALALQEGGDKGSLWYRYQLIRYQVPPTFKVLVPPILGAVATNIVQLIMNMTNSEWRSTSVHRETNGQDQTTPEHVTVASVSLSALLKAKNSFYKFLLVPSHKSLVPVPLPLVPGSTTFAQCCTRYHPSGTMVPLPLPCHPPTSYNLVKKTAMRYGEIGEIILATFGRNPRAGRIFIQYLGCLSPISEQKPGIRFKLVETFCGKLANLQT